MCSGGEEFPVSRFSHAISHALPTAYLYCAYREVSRYPTSYMKGGWMSDQHEEIIRRYYHDLFGTGSMQLQAIDQYMAADFVAYDLPLAQKGSEDYKRYIAMVGASFSDLHHSIDDIFG